MHVTMYYGNEQTSRSLQNASQFLEPHLFLIAPKVTRPHHRFTSPTLHDQEIGWSGIRMKCHATTDGERKRNNLSEKWLPWLNWKQNVAICKQNRRSNHFLAHHMQGEWTKELHLFFPEFASHSSFQGHSPTISISTICLTILCLILSAGLVCSTWAYLSLRHYHS